MTLLKAHAAVKGEVVSNRPRRYEVKWGCGLVVLSAGTELLPLNDNEMIVSENGEPILPSGRFYRTAETIDPHHFILDCHA